MKWTLTSYQALQSLHQPFHHSNPVFSHLRRLPPIVQKDKIDTLRRQLALAEQNKRVVMSAGDCAEAFQQANSFHWDKKVSMYKKFGDLLQKKFNKQPLLIGRLAGQYGKPRTVDFTEVNGERITTFKGDNVNDFSDTSKRHHSSDRLVEGYHHSLSTHNYFKERIPQLFICHEGLILPYQQSLTREIRDKHYCLSAHMLWIGERTRQLSGGHVQFFRGIENPIGVKVSTKMDPQEFLELVRTLNPKNQAGKLVIIIRAGEDKVTDLTTTLQELKRRHKLNFLFMSDPMHANTFQSIPSKLKTRNIKKIQGELERTFGVLKEHSVPCGMMFECTPEEVTECFGDSTVPTENELNPETYKTKCDPRVNLAQLQYLISNLSH